ncbi:hypothetical protein [Caballeronia grimmiae]|uniref:hypothetical protein n=1 Tax=Caballeronia grimmiae TaxID=1071679 RepID=UPI0038BDA5AD
MNVPEKEEYVRALTRNFAAALHIREPSVRFVKISASPNYDPLRNRIELGYAILTLPSLIVRVTIAHEVGHATQRKALLLDLAADGLCKMLIIAVPWIVYGWTARDKPWDIVISATAFVLAYGTYICTARAARTKQAIALEVKADEIAAILCGSHSTLRALETLSTFSLIRPERLEAFRARLAQERST